MFKRCGSSCAGGRSSLSEPPDLSGQNALVTGATRGVGLAIARGLTIAGASVAIVGRSKASLQEAAANLERALPVTADVRDRTAVEAAVEQAERELGPLDLLVNNAGTLAAIGPLWEVDPEDAWLDVETSVRGAVICSHAVLPGMIARRRGRIVNVSSYAGIRPSPYQSGYAAGKAALGNLTESLAVSTREHGIAVFAISPGFVRTALTDRLKETEEGRRWIPEAGAGGAIDAARSGDLVALLASGAADELSGRFLHVLDDVQDLIRRADEVRRDDLYVLRLRKPA